MFVLTLWSVRVTIVAMDAGLHVAVNNIKPSSVPMETQERVPSAAVELPNISYCRQQYKRILVFMSSARYCCPILVTSGVPRQIFVQAPT